MPEDRADFHIYVDADAMPRPLRDVLARVAVRENITTFFVAAAPPSIAENDQVRSIGAGRAFNGADDWIVEHLAPGDLAVTADIPLADRVLAKGAEALNTKGEFFTPANIKNALAMRELLDELRVAGTIAGGPAPFSDRKRVDFINALDRYVRRRKKS